jgi:regulator of protease activity HflC (stomatin/prohibitin superfamily)
MLDKLIDFVIQFIELFKFWIVIEPFEAGVLLHLGKFRRILECGFHFMWPFGIDKVLTEHIVPTTHSLGDESTISKDGKSIGFHAVVTYKVRDIQKALLDVEDVQHAIRDACCGEIGRVMRDSTWIEMLGEDILEKLTAACRKRGFRYGIEVMSVQLAGIATCRSIRLMQR